MADQNAKRAFITGSSAGLGRALAENLLGQGYTVTGVDISKPVGLTDNPAFTAITADLSSRDGVFRLAEDLRGFKPFDLVIHNAGISATGRFEDIPVAAHLKLLRLNAETPILLTGLFERSGLHAKGGSIVFVSSLSHATGYPGAASYAASKDALAIYARSIRKPFAARGHHVMTVFPGPVRTEHAARHAPPGAKADRRMAPEELARRIVDAVGQGRAELWPGPGGIMMKVLARLFPGLLTAAMRKALFEKLDRPVW